MQDVPARRSAAGALSATHRAGAEAAAELIARSASAHTRRVYASALGQLAAWLAGRRLDDAGLAAHLGCRARSTSPPHRNSRRRENAATAAAGTIATATRHHRAPRRPRPGARATPPDVGFMMRLLALCTLPRTNPGDRFQYIRANGPWRLTLATTGEAKLPYMGTCRGCCSRGSARKRSAESGPRTTRAEHPVASRRGTREIRRRADVRREFSRIHGSIGR